MSASFKTWKILEVDYSKSLNDYYNECEKSSINSLGVFENILNNVTLNHEKKIIPIKLVKIEFARMHKYGISFSCTNEEILNHFQKLGLYNCDIQTGLQLRCNYRQGIESIVMKVMTAPIVANNAKFQLVLMKKGKKHYLSAMDVKDNLCNLFITTFLVFRK